MLKRSSSALGSCATRSDRMRCRILNSRLKVRSENTEELDSDKNKPIHDYSLQRVELVGRDK